MPFLEGTSPLKIPLGCGAYRCSPIIINFFKQSPRLLLTAQKLPIKNLFRRSRLKVGLFQLGKIPLGCGAYRCIPSIINFFKQIPLLLFIAQKLPTKNLFRKSRQQAGLFQLEKSPWGVVLTDVAQLSSTSSNRSQSFC